MSIDNTVMSLMETLKQKREEFEILTEKTKTSWITNCVYSFRQDGTDQKNLQVMNESGVIELLGDVVMKEQAIRQARNLMSLSTKDIKIRGYTVEQWTADCQKRLATLSFNEKKKALDDLQTTLNSLISPELQREMMLREVAAKINSL
jgi:hypothetical protein